MSIISAGTSTTNALVTTGDTNGNLVFKTNNGTTALTIGTDQSATFVGNISAPNIGGSLLRQTVFTSSGTWTKGTGTKYILVEGVGGGGATGSNGSGALGTTAGGGGAGGYARKFIDVSAISTVAVTIGAGGTFEFGTSSSGGTTSFGTHISCVGGSPGGNANSSTSGRGGQGGTASNGDLNINGGDGSNGVAATSNIGGTGGASYFGGGGSGYTALGSASARSGVAYGSGAGGGADPTATTGAQGVIIVWEFA